VTITGTPALDQATFEAIEPGANKSLGKYAAAAGEIYDLALRHFLYTDFSRITPFLRWAIIKRLARMLRLMTTPIHAYVERFVSDQRLQQILEYPMVFLGTSPFEAPALYSLMGALDFKDGVYYPRGGMYTIIQSLVTIGREHGVTYHFNSAVSSITAHGGRATGITLADGQQASADLVISNADLHYTETSLLEPAQQSYPEAYWRTKQPASSALLIYLGIRGTVPELEHHNLLFVEAWRDNFEALYKNKTVPEKASLYLSRTSATDLGVAPAGHETLFVLVPLPAGIAPSAKESKAIATHYIAQIETMCKVSLVDRIVYQSEFTPADFGERFHSWQNSMLGPSHILRQSAFWRTKQKSRKLGNLYYVGGGTLPGIGLPMCLISAQVLAERIGRELA
jgi:phytoene desaturase